MRESPMMQIWDGAKLVGLEIHTPTATSPSPNAFELEITRIFVEYQQLQAEIKQAKDVRFKWQQIAQERKELYEERRELYERLQAEIADIKLELSTPETMGMEKEPLYIWAATIVCAKLRLQTENKRLKEKNEKLTTAIKTALDLLSKGG